VIDNTNLAIAKKNAENTGEIMKTNTNILEKTKEILGALSGSRDGSMGISTTGLGGNMSVSAAPSFSSIMNGGTLSFGGLDADSQNIAATLINGLQLVKQVKAIVEGEDTGAMNNAYSGGGQHRGAALGADAAGDARVSRNASSRCSRPPARSARPKTSRARSTPTPACSWRRRARSTS
jgi:hypothetical protein